MTKLLLGTLTLSVLLLAAPPSFAAAVCTLLTDTETGKVLSQEGACDRRYSPASTFKIPLSLMGYDTGILQDATTPALPYKPAYRASREVWRVTTNPTYWLAQSVVWYSQELTRKMGMEKFRHYVQGFDYGNQDVSGSPGKNDGLTRSWLSSSLKISPAEQAAFLRKLVKRQLPVSAKAFDMTEQIMPVTPLAGGWQVHGKTGTGFLPKADGSWNRDRQFGWFVGWATKGERQVIFVHLIQDEHKEEEAGGLRAKAEMLKSLPAMLEKL